MEEGCSGAPAVEEPTTRPSTSAHSSAQEAALGAAPGPQPSGSGAGSSNSAQSGAQEPAPGRRLAPRPTEEIIVGVNAQLERGSSSEHGSEGSAATQLHSLPEEGEEAPRLDPSASSDDGEAWTSSSSEAGAASPGQTKRRRRGKRKRAGSAQALSSWTAEAAPKAGGERPGPGQGGRRRKEERWRGLRVVHSSSSLVRRPPLPLQPPPPRSAAWVTPQGGSPRGTAPPCAALSMVTGDQATRAVQRQRRVRAWVDLLVVSGVIAGLCVSLGVGLTSLLSA